MYLKDVISKAHNLTEKGILINIENNNMPMKFFIIRCICDGSVH